MVLLGWALQLSVLTGLFGVITMKANAAVGLLVSGLALHCLNGRSPRHRLAGRVLALFVALLGALTFSEHLFGWTLGIDELLFTEKPGAVATASPGRMGPNASLSLMLAGIGLCCLSWETPRAIACAQVLGACTTALALVPTVGYLYGAAELYAVTRLTGIAVHTGVSLLALSIGLLAARSDAGPVAALTSDAPHGVMARRLLGPAIALPLLLGYIRVVGQREGLYDTGLGASMFVVAVIVLLSITIWRTAVALAQSDDARQSAEVALTETEQRFRSLADQAPALIWVEEGGERVWFNKRWFDFTGAAPAAVDWRSLVHPDDLPGWEARWQSAARFQTGYSHQYRLRRADGSYAWILETASPRLPTGGPAGYVGSCIDVTELRQAQQDREDLLVRERRAREKAERADRAKDDFIAALSHELRTPLNAILGWMQLLQHGAVSETGRSKATDAIVRNAGSLARLIEDLLDTSRITTGHFDLTRSPADMVAIVQAAVESVSPPAEAKGVRVAMTSDAAVPPVFGDGPRLQQVVWNLLTNAIKFSPTGGRVDVQVAVAGSSVAVRVRDEGDGIDAGVLPHVFERLWQGDSSPTRQAGGLGLGLYIAREITQLHGGHLEAHSDGIGRGATFTMHVPIAAEPAAALLTAGEDAIGRSAFPLPDAAGKPGPALGVVEASAVPADVRRDAGAAT